MEYGENHFKHLSNDKKVKLKRYRRSYYKQSKAK